MNGILPGLVSNFEDEELPLRYLDGELEVIIEPAMAFSSQHQFLAEKRGTRRANLAILFLTDTAILQFFLRRSATCRCTFSSKLGDGIEKQSR